nr:MULTISPECIES: hypothetical protein [Enterobacteriaceae]
MSTPSAQVAAGTSAGHRLALIIRESGIVFYPVRMPHLVDKRGISILY